MSAIAEVLVRAKDEFSGVTRLARKEFGDLAVESFKFATAAAAVTAALAAITKEAAEYGASLSLAHEKTGIAVGDLASFKLIAEQTGSSLEELGKGLRIYAKNVYEASQGGKEQAETFKALGIATTDAAGHQRSMTDLILETSQRFALMTDGTEKTALATKAFGKAGAELIPTLDKLGTEGIGKARAEVEKLGLAISDKFAEQSRQFNEKLKEVEGSLQGVGLSIASTTMPIFSAFADVLVDSTARLRTALNPYGQQLAAMEASAKSLKVTGQDAAAGLKSAFESFGKDNPAKFTIPGEEDEAEKLKKRIAQLTATLEAYKTIDREVEQNRKRLGHAIGGDDPLGDNLEASLKADQEHIKTMTDNYLDGLTLTIDAAKQKLEELDYWDKQLQGFRDRSGSMTENPAAEDVKQMGENSHRFVEKFLKQHEELKKKQEEFIKSFREGAGKVWDDFFLKGKGAFGDLVNLGKAFLSSITRTLFQELATGLVFGSKGGAGEKASGLAGLIGLGGSGGGILGKIPGLSKVFSSGGGGLLGGILGGAKDVNGFPAATIGGGGGMAGIGAFMTNPWTIGIAAGLLGGFALYKHFHHPQNAPFTRDPNDVQRNREFFFFSGLQEFKDASLMISRVMGNVSTMSPGQLVKAGLPMAMASSNQFTRDTANTLSLGD